MSPRSLAALGAVAVGLGATGIGLLLADPEPPPVVEQLEETQDATERAQAAGARLADALEAIASNLEEGSGLAERSDAIHALTERQRSSLQDVVSILAEQLASLERSQRVLERTESTTGAIAELSAAQAAAIRRSVAALRRLESAAAEAGRFSAEVANQARYAADLAEDSEEAFSRP